MNVLTFILNKFGLEKQNLGQKYIAIGTGNRGVAIYYGPFDSREAAIDYCTSKKLGRIFLRKTQPL